MALHKVTPRAVVEYPVSVSAPCSYGGDGQCDGWADDVWEGSETCRCACHSASDLPNTVAGVEAWHAEQHRIPSNRRMQGVDIPRHVR